MPRIPRVQRTKKISVLVTPTVQEKMRVWANRYDLDINNFMVQATLEKIDRLEKESSRDIVLNEILSIMKENQKDR